MSKSWLTLVIIAAITLLAWTGFQLYVAISGRANEEFDYVIEPIENRLPEELLVKLGEKEDRILIKVTDIDVKAVEEEDFSGPQQPGL